MIALRDECLAAYVTSGPVRPASIHWNLEEDDVQIEKCVRCGKIRPCRFTPDPYWLGMIGDTDRDWFCKPCHDDREEELDCG